MDISKSNEVNYRCDKEEYLLFITNIDDLRLIDFWLRIKSTVKMNITEGHITLNGLKEIKKDIEEIINKLEG